jgi:putative FmdB family regulatory protein
MAFSLVDQSDIINGLLGRLFAFCPIILGRPGDNRHLNRCGRFTMPIYEYHCEACGLRKEHLQKMSDAPLAACPACGSADYKKQLSAAGFQLKGSGWYATDFKGDSSSTSSSSSAAGGGGHSCAAGSCGHS